MIVGVSVGVTVLKIWFCCAPSVVFCMKLPSAVKPAAEVPKLLAPSMVAMKTIIWQVAGLEQLPCSRKPSGRLGCEVSLPMRVPEVSSRVTDWLATSPVFGSEKVVPDPPTGKTMALPLQTTGLPDSVIVREVRISTAGGTALGSVAKLVSPVVTGTSGSVVVFGSALTT